MRHFKLLFFVTCMLFNVQQVFCQNGFLAKKNYVEIIGFGNIPLLSGAFTEDYYRIKKENLVKDRDWLDYGASLSYSRVFSTKISLGLTLSAKKYDLSLPSSFVSTYYINSQTPSTDSTQIRWSSLNVTNYVVAPRFQYVPNIGQHGAGIAYEFLMGINFSQIVNKSYAYQINESNTDEDSWTEIDYYNTNLEWGKRYGLFIQAGIKYRIPLTRQFILSMGLNYTSTFLFRPRNFESNYDSDLFNSSDVFFQQQRENLFSISGNFGVTYFF